ncbi:RHS repeat-associated core domain-containing protein, partial [Chryseobacterium sp. LC2016-27]|uniref:RHS repeat-associated core domain-containing protein n=1 Tax=Chryseobacterium sp. LC2016-27 TaxID=2897326 RepID=UPI001E4682E4
GLQQVDYLYNIRGWMTQINDPANLGSDLFGYKIKYNQVEGEQTPNNDFSTLQVKPKYNGNIAEVDWKSNTTTGDNLRRYGYVYDGLNRLLAGFYQKDTNPTAKEYFEKMDYDLNGNITNLKRSASKDGNAFATTIDNLDYVYENNNQSNRLIKVTDISQNYQGYPDASGNTISYDLNGNMKYHIDKGILQIDYNFLNLPNYIMFNEGLSTRTGVIRNNLTYKYRADGSKLKKIYKYAPFDPFGTAQQLETKETDYLDSFQYEGKYVNSGDPKGGGTITFITSLQFVPTSEGYFDFVKNKYIYNYNDHLGNTRLSYFHNGSSIEVLEENNYYPFGLKHEGYNALAGNSSYQYKYNGKELQETGMYDYGARFYMPDIGRWGVVDPLAETSRRFSPYTYVYNNPISFIDPTGMIGELATCPNCPNTAEFKPYIDSKTEYFYDSETNKVTKVGQIEEVKLQGSSSWNVGTRALGGLQMVGGALETVVGGVGGILTAETGVGAALGWLVLMNGIDNTTTGAQQLWTGEDEETLLHQGVEEGSLALGADEETAENIATGADVATLALGGGSSLKNTKLLRGSGGKVNGISKGSRSGYGAQKRFDIHPLKHPSRKTSKLTLPKWIIDKKVPVPHYHRGKGSNLKYHRPWEKGPDGKRRL